ncbi:hypothetical protein [Nisaea denitrificans]|uniref:hypothetical protein n=1 Tax=Nisaea denitrificans TaxID=390877 RepID=UPI00048A880D|nr:hypothetical protein [Nisaea denitrificans]
MGDFYFSAKLNHNQTLNISPLTNRKIALSDTELSDVSGYFLYEQKSHEGTETIEIIAQLFSDDAVLRLKDALKMS